MMRKWTLVLVLGALLVLVALPAAAQDDMAPVATGLNSPRGLFYTDDGTLYIAEAGLAGEIESMGPFGPAVAGYTGQVTVVAPDGTQQALVTGLPSLSWGEGEYVGPSAVYVDDSSIWVVTGHEVPNFPLSAAVLGLDRTSLRLHTALDLYSFEHDNNPDGDSEDVVSNPTDIAVGEDAVYIVDASGNSVQRWTPGPDSELENFAAWEAGPVPDTVAVGPDGDVYVGFLTSFPFAEGSATIERYSPDGTLEETYSGLTAVTDIHVAEDGTIYAVEFARFGDQGWAPDTGRVVTVSADGVEVVADGLNYPYALAQSPDGQMVVSVNSIHSEAGGGMVIAVPMAGA